MSQEFSEDTHEQMVQELTERWQRAVADYQNLERRAVELEERARGLAIVRVVRELLPVFDALDRAAEHDEGARHVRKTLVTQLQNMGVEKQENGSGSFDPNLHEAVGFDPEGDAEIISDVQLPGYYLNGLVIRPMHVVVGVKEKEVKE